MVAMSEYNLLQIPKKVNFADLNTFFSDTEPGLTELKETVGPWRRFML